MMNTKRIILSYLIFLKEVLLKVKEMTMRVKILENVMDYMENHLADCGAAIQV